MIPIVRIPGDFILTEYRDPTWQIIEETIDSVKEVILCIYCNDQKDIVKIANYVNDHDNKLKIKTLIQLKDVVNNDRYFLDVTEGRSKSRFQIQNTTVEGIINAMVFLKNHFSFLDRDKKIKSQKRNDSPDHDIYKK